MQNLLLIHKKNDLYFVKCNETGAIVKFDENHYHKLLNKDNDIISDLNKIGFFSKSCNDVESLSLFIMMNNTCNLNCSYCFEHDKKNIYFNDTNIEEFIKKLHRFVNDCKIKSLDITFTGGEPLLQYKNLMIMTESIVKLCKECLVELSFSVITNGTVITKQMISFFEKYNFSIQITLDGNKDRHDKIRHFFDKSGSFDIIYSKLREISLLSKLYVSIRINVNTPCFDEYKQLLEKLYNDFPNYKIYIDFLDVPLNSNLYIGLEKKEQFFKQYINFMHLHGRRDFYNYLEGSLCMIRNKKSFTIDSKLNIYRCYSFVDGTYFKFDSYKNLLESHFNNSLVCNELSCEIYDFCCGGCIYKNYINTGEINIVCRKNHILNMNSIIFMSEIYKGNYDEKEKNIEYKKIDL